MFRKIFAILSITLTISNIQIRAQEHPKGIISASELSVLRQRIETAPYKEMYEEILNEEMALRQKPERSVYEHAILMRLQAFSFALNVLKHSNISKMTLNLFETPIPLDLRAEQSFVTWPMLTTSVIPPGVINKEYEWPMYYLNLCRVFQPIWEYRLITGLRATGWEYAMEVRYWRLLC